MCTKKVEVSVPVRLVPVEEWENSRNEIKEQGRMIATLKREQGEILGLESGREVLPSILCSKEGPGGIETQLAAVMLDVNGDKGWKLSKKVELVEDINNVLAKLELIDLLYPQLPIILGAVLEEKGLAQYSIGEFWLLYGKFEERTKNEPGKTDDKIRKRLEESGRTDETNTKFYKLKKDVIPETNEIIEKPQPLPYVVRNILGHIGTDKAGNTLNSDELKNAIQLLNELLAPPTPEADDA